MAVIAANNVTNNSPASAASGSTDASASGDVFSAMLDEIAQNPANNTAAAGADATVSNASATANDASPAPSDPAAQNNTTAIDPILAELLAAQQVAVSAPATTPPPSNINASNTADTTDTPADAADEGIPAAQTAVDPATPARETSDAGEPASVPATAASADATPNKTDPDAAPRDDVVSGTDGKPADRPHAAGHHRARSEAAQANDLMPGDSVTGEPATNDPGQTDPVRATDTTPPSTASALTAAPLSPATDALMAETAASATPTTTDQAASGVVANGSIAKPAKNTAGGTSTGSSKSEERSSKANALADAGDVAKRGFASEPAVRAAALPVHDKADDGEQTSSNGARASTPQHNAANPATIATPAQPDAAPPVQQAVTPAPIHAAQQPTPQVDPAVGIATVNTAASPTQTPATPAHLAAQIQVSQHTPDVDALAVNIAAHSQDGQKHFDIRLDPAELGRVDVRLTVDDAGKAQAMLTVEKPQTLELLQKDQSHLERALKDAGLDLTQNGLSFSLKGQQQQQAQDHTPFARGQRLTARALAAIDDVTPTLSTSGLATSDTRLDIRV